VDNLETFLALQCYAVWYLWDMEAVTTGRDITLPEGEWLRLDEALKRLSASGLRVGVWTAREWIRYRHIRAVKVLTRWYVCWDDIVAKIKPNWGPEAPTK